jgi:hypothetical protein
MNKNKALLLPRLCTRLLSCSYFVDVVMVTKTLGSGNLSYLTTV